MCKFSSREACAVFMMSTHQSFQLLYRVLYTKSPQRYYLLLSLSADNMLKDSTGTFKFVCKYLKPNYLYYNTNTLLLFSDCIPHLGVCLKWLLPSTLKSSTVEHCSVHHRQHGTKSTRHKEGVKIFQTISTLGQLKVSFFSCSQKQLFLYQVMNGIQINLAKLCHSQVKNTVFTEPLLSMLTKQRYGGDEINVIWLLKQEQVARNNLDREAHKRFLAISQPHYKSYTTYIIITTKQITIVAEQSFIESEQLLEAPLCNNCHSTTQEVQVELMPSTDRHWKWDPCTHCPKRVRGGNEGGRESALVTISCENRCLNYNRVSQITKKYFSCTFEEAHLGQEHQSLYREVI